MQKEICYKKLFKLMIDRNMKGHDLREKAGISQSTYFKLQHDQPVSTQMLVRICCALDCELWDINYGLITHIEHLKQKKKMDIRLFALKENP